MSTWTSLDVDDVDDDFHMSDNSSVLVRTMTSAVAFVYY